MGEADSLLTWEERDAGKSKSTTKMPQSLTYDLVDPLGLDNDTLFRINDSDQKAVIVHQCLMDLIMHNISINVLDAPPPLMTRFFQEIGSSMTQFHEAGKYADSPFPLPYMAVTSLAMLCTGV